MLLLKATLILVSTNKITKKVQILVNNLGGEAFGYQLLIAISINQQEPFIFRIFVT